VDLVCKVSVVFILALIVIGVNGWLKNLCDIPDLSHPTQMSYNI